MEDLKCTVDGEKCKAYLFASDVSLEQARSYIEMRKFIEEKSFTITVNGVVIGKIESWKPSE